MSSSSMTPCIHPNPDISGIGVRVSIYAQAFLGILRIFLFLVDGKITLEEGLAINDIIVTNELTASALLVSAIIQERTFGLSVYHANIVLILSWITFLPVIATAFGQVIIRSTGGVIERQAQAQALTRASGKSNVRWNLQVLVLWVHYVAVAGLGIWVWRDVREFGDQPECTAQTFVVIFGYNIFVTKFSLKVVALYLYGSLAAAAVMVFFWFLYDNLRKVFSNLRGTILRPTPLLDSAGHGPQASDPIIPENPIRRNARTSLPIFCLILTATGIEILFVACTEVLIKRSRGLVQSGESEWTFGQSLAMFLVAIPLAQTSTDLEKYYREWRGVKRGLSDAIKAATVR